MSLSLLSLNNTIPDPSYAHTYPSKYRGAPDVLMVFKITLFDSYQIIIICRYAELYIIVKTILETTLACVRTSLSRDWGLY